MPGHCFRTPAVCFPGVWMRKLALVPSKRLSWSRDGTLCINIQPFQPVCERELKPLKMANTSIYCALCSVLSLGLCVHMCKIHENPPGTSRPRASFTFRGHMCDIFAYLEPHQRLEYELVSATVTQFGPHTRCKVCFNR